MILAFVLYLLPGLACGVYVYDLGMRLGDSLELDLQTGDQELDHQQFMVVAAAITVFVWPLFLISLGVMHLTSREK